MKDAARAARTGPDVPRCFLQLLGGQRTKLGGDRLAPDIAADDQERAGGIHVREVVGELATGKVAPGVLEECGRAGIRSAIVISGGFKEAEGGGGLNACSCAARKSNCESYISG